MKRNTLYILLIILFIFPLVGCNTISEDTKSAVVVVNMTRVWFDFPLDGSDMPLGTYDLVSHSADNAGIAQVEWSINGSVVSAESVSQAKNTTENLSEFHHAWTPTEPGQYELKVRAQSTSGDWTMPAKADVTILGAMTPTPTETSIPTSTATESLTPTQTETPTVTPTVDAGLELVDMTRSSEEFYYGTCSPNSISFTIRATNPDKVKYMYLFYRLQDLSTGEKTETNDGLPMNKTGADTWTITLKYSQLGNYSQYDESWFIYQFVSQGPDKTMTRSQSWGDLKYSVCGSGSGPKKGITTTPTWDGDNVLHVLP